MNKKILSAALIAAMACSNAGVFAAANYQVQQAANPYSTYTQQPSYNTQTLKGKVVMIPAGVSIPAMTNMVLSSESLLSVRAYLFLFVTTFITAILWLRRRAAA